MSHRYVPKKDPATGESYIPVTERGHALLDDSLYNKGTAWPLEERSRLGILGLLPPHVSTEEEQKARAYGNYGRRETDLERYVFLQELQDRNEVLFYKLLTAHLDEMLPIVYTPTVGRACREFHLIFRRSRGLYVSARDADRSAELIRNASEHAPVEVAVVTDGQRILGLGDLGAGGMGIPIGKLALYVAGAGLHPATALPVLLDVGTDNAALIDDPLYLGNRAPRLRGEEYDQVVEAFVSGFEEACPGALLQFEDFGKGNAFRVLDRYRDRLACFNDDIQGTGAVTLAGILSALRLTGGRLAEQRFLLVGAGGAGIGIARALRAAVREEGGEGAEGIHLVDSAGLVVRDRRRLDPPKEEFALDRDRVSALGVPDASVPLARLVEAVKPTVLIGTTGQRDLFGREIVRAAAEAVERPVVLPLSNPTAQSEADPRHVLEWSEGRALVATGSPFPAVRLGSEERLVGQCNNVFVFPGVGLGVRMSGASRVTDSMFTRAARALADCVTGDRLRRGALFPPIGEIRRVSARVAAAVAEEAESLGLASVTAPDGWEEEARRAMWIPRYLPYRYEPA